MGMLSVTASGELDVNNVTAGASAEFEAGGTATFLVTYVAAPTITVTSSDIEIVDGAFLGEYRHHDVVDLERG